jgi:hypothetical protein
MSVDFYCRCGKRLVAGDELAGKEARCSRCQTIVVVPAIERVADTTDLLRDLQAGAQPAVGVASAPPSVPPPVPPVQASRQCPHCKARSAPAAVLCVSCGYDFRTGQRVATAATPSAASAPVSAVATTSAVDPRRRSRGVDVEAARQFERDHPTLSVALVRVPRICSWVVVVSPLLLVFSLFIPGLRLPALLVILAAIVGVPVALLVWVILMALAKSAGASGWGLKVARTKGIVAGSLWFGLVLLTVLLAIAAVDFFQSLIKMSGH